MRRALIAALLASLAAPVAAQEITLDDPALAEGLEAVPSAEDVAAVVAAENAQARPQVDAQTLADMQAALRAVSADLQALRAELLASGASGFAAAGGDSAIDRMNAMEAQIAALTDRTEQLSNRIARVVADGGNRIGDIEFRLCELDPNCDLGALMTADLGQQGGGFDAPDGPGGGLPSTISSQTLPPPDDDALPETDAPPTEEEAREFASARAAVKEGRWQDALRELDHLIAAHAGGPLTAEALYLRGLALQAEGQVQPAAESWLNAFSAAPDGPRAAASLLGLSQAVTALGEAKDACPYLTELTRRFPDAAEAPEAFAAAEAAGCAAEGDGAD